MACDQKDATTFIPYEVQAGTKLNGKAGYSELRAKTPARGVADQSGTVRMDRVIQLRNRIAQGTYRVSSDDLAGAMMRCAHPGA